MKSMVIHLRPGWVALHAAWNLEEIRFWHFLAMAKIRFSGQNIHPWIYIGTLPPSPRGRGGPNYFQTFKLTSGQVSNMLFNECLCQISEDTSKFAVWFYLADLISNDWHVHKQSSNSLFLKVLVILAILASSCWISNNIRQIFQGGLCHYHIALMGTRHVIFVIFCKLYLVPNTPITIT